MPIVVTKQRATSIRSNVCLYVHYVLLLICTDIFCLRGALVEPLLGRQLVLDVLLGKGFSVVESFETVGLFVGVGGNEVREYGEV